MRSGTIVDKYPLNQTLSDTLVIHCADPRFREAFRQFTTRESGIKQYTLISIAGGAGYFTRHDEDSENLKVILEHLRLFLESPLLRRVLAFNHAKCLWYGDHHAELDARTLAQRQESDLGRLSKLLRSRYPAILVETYMADIDREGIVLRKTG